MKRKDALKFVKAALRALPLVAVLPAVLLVACSSESGDAWPDGVEVDTLAGGGIQVRTPGEGVWAMTGTEPWRVVEDLRIGEADGEGPYLFGSVRNVIPDAHGRIWVMDSQARELRLFGPDGQYLRTVGGAGEGPGEFQTNPCAFPGPNGEVWVEDFRYWHRFDGEGAHVATLFRLNTLGCGVRQWTPDGRLVMVSTEGSMARGDQRSFFVVYSLADDGQVMPGDTFSTPERPTAHSITWIDPEGIGRIILQIPFVHRPSWVLGPMGELFVSDREGAYEIRRASLAGDTLLVMGRPHEPVPIDASVRTATIDGFAEGVRSRGFTPEPPFTPSLVPTVYPPLSRFFIGHDGSVWVRSEQGPDLEVLDLFSPDGRFLGRVDVPDDFHRMFIQAVVGDHMYGSVQDDLGIAYAVRLRIERP
jgi:hypothetical protein